MPEQNQTNEDADKAKRTNRNPFSAAYVMFKLLPIGLRRILVAALVAFLVLLLVSVFHPSMVERVKFFTVNALSLFVLAAIAVQALIYRQQAGTMEKQWKAMTDQLEAIQKQEGYLRTQAESMQAQAGIMEGQLAAMRDTLLHSERQILLGQTQMQIAGEAMKISRQGVENAERNSIYAQRAYVVAKIRGVGKRDDTLQFRLRIENSGNTPANNVWIYYAYGLRDKPPHDESEKPVAFNDAFTETERLGLIAPHGSYEVISTLETSFWSPGFESGELQFYCWGRIDYKDIFNKTRTAWFCFVQSPSHPKGYPCKHGNETY